MIRLIVFLVVAVLLAWLATWLADHPGRVALTWQGTQIETSFGVMLLAVLVIGVALTVLFEIVRLIRRAPKAIGSRRRQVRTEKGYEALSQGLIAAASGDAASAKQLNRRAEKLLGPAPQTLLLGAQTAQLEGDEGSARLKYQQMLKHGETEVVGLRGLVAQAIKDGDTQSALRLARRAYLRRPHTPWVLTTLFDLQTRAGLWTEALSTVGDMARHKLIDRPTATRRRAILFHQQAADRRAEGRPYEALSLARKAHKLLPSLAPIAVQAASLAEQTNQPRLARKIVETAWKAEPHPELAQAYLAQGGKAGAAERLEAMQRLHRLAPPEGHPASELALASEAIAARKWQTAREVLERARKRQATASVWRLLAELAQAEGDGETARADLARAMDAPPDPAWLCTRTGEAVANWSAFGPDGRFDSLRWSSPPKIVPLMRPGAAAELIPPDGKNGKAGAPPRPDEVDAA